MSSGPFDLEPAGQPAATQPVVRPAEINTSFSLWIAAVAVYLLLIPVTMSRTRGTVAATLQRPDAPGRPIDPAAIESVLNIMMTSVAVVSALLAGVWLLFILKMRAGQSWARIVLTVLAVIDLLVSLASLVTDRGSGFVATILSVVEIILIAAATLMMFRPGVGGYFARR
ncbi:MAG TPA: hypothetical protein VGH89_28620 [Pseudonocardia sp.]|jgi:hypothetical protein